MTQKVDDLRISNAVLESDLKEYKIIWIIKDILAFL